MLIGTTNTIGVAGMNDAELEIDIMNTTRNDSITSILRDIATRSCKPIPNEEGLTQEFYPWYIPYNDVEEYE